MDEHDALTNQIAQKLRRAGFTIYHLSLTSVPPPLLVGYQGRTTLIRVKPLGEALYPDQQQWDNRWKGEPPIVATCAEDVLIAFGLFDQPVLI